jgi:hypothetical protein
LPDSDVSLSRGGLASWLSKIGRVVDRNRSDSPPLGQRKCETFDPRREDSNLALVVLATGVPVCRNPGCDVPILASPAVARASQVEVRLPPASDANHVALALPILDRAEEPTAYRLHSEAVLPRHRHPSSAVAERLDPRLQAFVAVAERLDPRLQAFVAGADRLDPQLQAFVAAAEGVLPVPASEVVAAEGDVEVQVPEVVVEVAVAEGVEDEEAVVAAEGRTPG